MYLYKFKIIINFYINSVYVTLFIKHSNALKYINIFKYCITQEIYIKAYNT